MLVCRWLASLMAAAVLPTAVGPTMIMTVGVCKILVPCLSKSSAAYQLFLGTGILTGFFAFFTLLGLFGFGSLS